MSIDVKNGWAPPKFMPREDVINGSKQVLDARPIKTTVTEDVFRIEELGMLWDIGVEVTEPSNSTDCLKGPDGKFVGMLLLHGGAGDFKSMRTLAQVFASRFGVKVVTMSFPGRHYLRDESRDWPGDTIHGDGAVRTPIWVKGEIISPDEYELVVDEGKRHKYGRRLHARAKPGTNFHARMSAWPAAFETGMKTACANHFLPADWSVFVHGHSTGGPFVSMLSQRVDNIRGVFALENSSFGYINEQKHIWGGNSGKIEGYEQTRPNGDPWKDPFTDLYIRTWRDLARYKGPEALGQEGPAALMRLPSLMEELFDKWETARRRPQFKAEYIVTHNIESSLEAAASTVAKRLGMTTAEADRLKDRYLSFTRELSGDGVKTVPPFYFIITKDSRDHSPEVYDEVILPMFAQMNPAPRTALTRLGAGVHTYTTPEEGLPEGVTPVAVALFVDAVKNGFFHVENSLNTNEIDVNR